MNLTVVLSLPREVGSSGTLIDRQIQQETDRLAISRKLSCSRQELLGRIANLSRGILVPESVIKKLTRTHGKTEDIEYLVDFLKIAQLMAKPGVTSWHSTLKFLGKFLHKNRRGLLSSFKWMEENLNLNFNLNLDGSVQCSVPLELMRGVRGKYNTRERAPVSIKNNINNNKNLESEKHLTSETNTREQEKIIRLRTSSAEGGLVEEEILREPPEVETSTEVLGLLEKLYGQLGVGVPPQVKVRAPRLMRVFGGADGVKDFLNSLVDQAAGANKPQSYLTAVICREADSHGGSRVRI